MCIELERASEQKQSTTINIDNIFYLKNSLVFRHRHKYLNITWFDKEGDK